MTDFPAHWSGGIITAVVLDRVSSDNDDELELSVTVAQAVAGVRTGDRARFSRCVKTREALIDAEALLALIAGRERGELVELELAAAPEGYRYAGEPPRIEGPFVMRATADFLHQVANALEITCARLAVGSRHIGQRVDLELEQGSYVARRTGQARAEEEART